MIIVIPEKEWEELGSSSLSFVEEIVGMGVPGFGEILKKAKEAMTIEAAQGMFDADHLSFHRGEDGSVAITIHEDVVFAISATTRTYASFAADLFTLVLPVVRMVQRFTKAMDRDIEKLTSLLAPKSKVAPAPSVETPVPEAGATSQAAPAAE